jgi:tetratricopeptide (TPR) repeat protein
MVNRDQAQALRLAREAVDLWQEGRLAEAEERYRAALAHSDPRHHRTADIHGEYAGLLTSLHRADDAGRQYERALQLELQHDSDESAPAVVAARYILGEHYLRLGEPDSARLVVAPSLLASQQPLAWLVEAAALFLSGSRAEARAAADRALALSTNAEQRERIRARLSELWESSEGDS